MFNEFQQVWGERRKFHVFVKLLGMVTGYEEGLNIEKGVANGFINMESYLIVDLIVERGMSLLSILSDVIIRW